MRKLTIKRFLSHKKTILNFPSKASITAIVGSTDSGKSALMAALRYLYLLDKGYPRYGEDGCEVEAVQNDGTVIKRSTTYALDGKKLTDFVKVSRRKVPFTKFGTKMPQGVIDITRISKLEIEDLKYDLCLNFIGQWDQILPKAMRPSQVSKFFGSLSGRNKVDSAIKATNAILRRLKGDKARLESEAKTQDQEILLAEKEIPPNRPDLDDLLSDMEDNDTLLTTAAILDTELRSQGKMETVIQSITEVLEATDMAVVSKEFERLRKVVQLAPEIVDIPDIDFDGFNKIVEHASSHDKEMESLSLVVKIVQDLSIEEMKLDQFEKELKQADIDLLSTQHKIDELLSTGFCPYSGEKLPGPCKKSLAT